MGERSQEPGARYVLPAVEVSGVFFSIQSAT